MKQNITMWEEDTKTLTPQDPRLREMMFRGVEMQNIIMDMMLNADPGRKVQLKIFMTRLNVELNKPRVLPKTN